MNEAIAVFNAGSTSLKFGAYAVDAGGKPMDAHEWGEGHTVNHKTALHFLITWLEANLVGTKVIAAGHRVVLGGGAGVLEAGHLAALRVDPGHHVPDGAILACLTSSPSRTRKSFDLFSFPSFRRGCYRDSTSASNPEITSKSSSSMPLWRS